MNIFGLVFFTILTLLLAYYIAVNIYRFFKDKKKYGSEAKRLPKDFTYSQRIFIAKFKRNLLEQDEKEIKK
ncbi:hypothetical protein [Spiroplasma endosymbiont of 'Nebria riversi']|uniref:hypothetical protein n=1 Tax=Spiroplasma endosymbiont of 'Nebria riversi' TaxID=2792084 RepID=UPI001C03F47E|nr:hypothetical protein [Spiroplasma endosymbiont of 'Nebria riversi']